MITDEHRRARWRTWRPLLGRLWFPGRVRLSLPGEWAWRRKRQGKREGTR